MNQQILDFAMHAIGQKETYRVIDKLPMRWHKDLQYKIEMNATFYAARIMKKTREFNCIPPVFLDNDMLREQLKLGTFYNENHIPFMKNYMPDCQYKTFQYQGNEYRLILHQWVEGDVVRYSTENIAYFMGNITRKMHDATSGMKSHALVETSGRRDFWERLQILEENRVSRCECLDTYIEFAKVAFEKGFSSDSELIAVQGDLNFGNIILNEEEQIQGIIDFDSIGLSSRVNEFVGVMKWYSKNKNEEYDSRLARKIWEGYGAMDSFTKKELQCLPYLVWLRNCLTNKFIKYYLLSIKDNSTEEIIKRYLKSGFDIYKICERLSQDD